MTTCYEKTYTELSDGAVDFGVRDKRGRAVGYRWFIRSVVFTPSENRWGYVAPEGLPLEHLEVSAFPTRDDRHYGASKRGFSCLTQAEAEAFIAKRVANARKRETKRFGGQL